MSLTKLIPFQGLIRTVLLFVLGLIVIVIFFIAFGKFFIPLLLTVIVVALMYFTGMARKTPPYQMILFVLLTFGMGYFIQKLTVVQMSTVEGEIPATTEFWGFTVLFVVLLFALAYIAKKKSAKVLFKASVH